MKGRREQPRGKKRTVPLIAAGVVTIFLLASVILLTQGGDGSSTAANDPSTAPPAGGTASPEIVLSPWLIGGDDPETALERPHAILDYAIPDTGLVIESVGQYTGPNIEDGQDTPTGNAASVVLRNDSDRVLQYAMLTLQAGEAQVSFKITTLPPGARVQAIALDGQAYQPEATYSYLSCETAYSDSISKMDTLFRTEGESGSLTLTNLSDESYQHVSVYYKYIQDDIYLGGITYRCTFENVAPGASLQQAAGHYDPATCEIMMLTTD